jgi:hypothetical protein
MKLCCSQYHSSSDYIKVITKQIAKRMFYSVFSFFTGVCGMMSRCHIRTLKYILYFTLFEIRAYSALLYVSLCFNTLLLYLLVYFCDRVPCTHSSGQCMILYTTVVYTVLCTNNIRLLPQYITSTTVLLLCIVHTLATGYRSTSSIDIDSIQ